MIDDMRYNYSIFTYFFSFKVTSADLSDSFDWNEFLQDEDIKELSQNSIKA